MRKSLPIIAAVLTACGAAVTTPDNAADASQGSRRGKQIRPAEDPMIREAREMEAAIEGGGMPGCFDPSLRGRERVVAERLGGRPCETPNRPATTSAAPPASIVGMWVMQDGYCASGDPIAFERDGRYATNEGDNQGRWSLSSDRLTIIYREVEEDGVGAVGPQHRVSYRLTRVNANEIRLDADRYRRCPTNGAEPWHSRG